MSNNQEIVLSPRASVLVESLRDMGYSLRTALADVIDNSITAGALNIDILADTHHAMPAIGVLDDGCGMTQLELFEAMRPGSQSPLDTRCRDDLGRFGLGLKTASFSQCRRLTVLTRKDEVLSCATWDLDLVAERDEWVVEIIDSNSLTQFGWIERLLAKGTDGTMVIWEKLDRLIGTGSPQGSEELVHQLNQASTHLEFVFHRYLAGRESKKLKISLNDRELKPVDPFHSNHPATQFHSNEIIRLRGSTIKIWPVTLPHHDKMSKSDWQRYAGPEGYVSNQGFYLYRNRRLILHGTWFRLARQLELTKLARVGIDISNTLDAEWKIDVKKASAQPPPPVRERLKKIVEKMGIPSRRIYTKRGTKVAGDSRLPVWERRQNKNLISYEINTDHPLIAKFSESLSDELIQEFTRLLRLVAAALPLEAMYVDSSVCPDIGQSSVISNSDLKEIVTVMWRTLKNRGMLNEEIKESMGSSEPFRSDWERTLKIIDGLNSEDD